MMEASANRALASDGTMEGQQAIVRMTLLLAMLERIESSGTSWDDCDLLPETLPVLSGLEYRASKPLAH